MSVRSALCEVLVGDFNHDERTNPENSQLSDVPLHILCRETEAQYDLDAHL
jgi:hypothetical protein